MSERVDRVATTAVVESLENMAFMEVLAVTEARRPAVAEETLAVKQQVLAPVQGKVGYCCHSLQCRRQATISCRTAVAEFLNGPFSPCCEPGGEKKSPRQGRFAGHADGDLA